MALSNVVGSLVSQSKNQRVDKFMKIEKAKTVTFLRPGYISDIYEDWWLWWWSVGDGGCDGLCFCEL